MCSLNTVFSLDGQSFLATARLTNMNYTEALSDPNSDAYKEFCRSVINEVRWIPYLSKHMIKNVST